MSVRSSPSECDSYFKSEFLYLFFKLTVVWFGCYSVHLDASFPCHYNVTTTWHCSPILPYLHCRPLGFL